MKNLPIGIPSIENIINQNYVYVDKTDIIYKLITKGKYYFLSRPRRFGKSLLLTTLEAIFKGNKELFKNCHIYNTDYAWSKHPVIYFDFARISVANPEELAAGLQKVLKETALSYNRTIECPNLREGLVNLVMELSELGRVVVLIDEYDSPLIDHLEQLDIAQGNQAVLKNFYGTLKGLDKQLQFVFATGVTKFSKVSLFSGFNNLKDITLHPDYATLLGYTASDLQNFLGGQVRQVAEKRRSMGADGATEQAIFAEMKEWYNGYRFAWGAEPVYNPHSTLNFLDTGMIENYWCETGTTTLLVQQVRKQPSSVMKFGRLVAQRSNLLDINDLTQLDLVPLMWQSGYLTIQGYEQASRDYRLDFPNREVREAFFEVLVQKFAKLEVQTVNEVAVRCKEYLERRELSLFIGIIRSLFAAIPSTLFAKQSEAFYHALFLVLLRAMDITVQAEVMTGLGRLDLIIEMESFIYILELKLDKDADTALEQTIEKDYKLPFVIKEKDVIAMGIDFNSEGRNISDCKAITYHKDGSEKREIVFSSPARMKTDLRKKRPN